MVRAAKERAFRLCHRRRRESFLFAVAAYCSSLPRCKASFVFAIIDDEKACLCCCLLLVPPLQGSRLYLCHRQWRRASIP
ncbi:hypothetical protein TIFTF001_012700 [Ficus carica]|uniref:Uncharacterized protein n=1 Tax=Ficus carica TaxID=3494 RepID=A0AA88A265_FICCA|nr:hypothetical protein TIFTF001_012700 [Ficus carica]